MMYLVSDSESHCVVTVRARNGGHVGQPLAGVLRARAATGSAEHRVAAG